MGKIEELEQELERKKEELELSELTKANIQELIDTTHELASVRTVIQLLRDREDE